jgi:isopentenyl-diphosphate delta-isomerase
VAAVRRLQEELGFTTPLQKIFAFTYKANVENGLMEHEYDHVFAGEYEGEININPNEVHSYCYETLEDIQNSFIGHPKAYTEWFKIAFPQIQTWWRNNYVAGSTFKIRVK